MFSQEPNKQPRKILPKKKKNRNGNPKTLESEAKGSKNKLNTQLMKSCAETTMTGKYQGRRRPPPRPKIRTQETPPQRRRWSCRLL